MVLDNTILLLLDYVAITFKKFLLSETFLHIGENNPMQLETSSGVTE